MTGTPSGYGYTKNFLNIEVNIKDKIKRPITDNVPNLLKYYRKINGYSQLDVANKIGFKNNRNIIKDYELGKILPSRDVSVKLAKLFNINKKYFYDDYFIFLDKAPNILKEYRRNKNLNKTQLADLLGTSYSIISRWEKGYIISRNYYKKIKELLE